MIALASWAKQAVDVRLTIDWTALGWTATARVTRRRSRFQEGDVRPAASVPIAPGKGWLLVVR